MKVRELIAVLGYEIEDKEVIAKFDRSIDQIKDGLGDLAKLAGLASVAIGGLAFGMNKAARQAANYTEDVYRNSDAFGAAVEEYQSLTFAMTELGGSTDDVRDLMGTLTDRIKDAAQGSKTYKDDFQQLLGIGPDQIARWDKMNPTDKLMEFLDVMERTPDLSDKLTASVRLFGDDLGRRVIPAVTASGQAIKDYMEIAVETGLAMDETFIRKGEEGRRQLRFLDALLQSITNRIGVELLPVMSEIIRKFRGWWAENGKDVLTRLLPEAVAYISDEMTKMRKRFEAVNKIVTESMGGWRRLAAILGALGASIASIMTALALFKIGAGIKGILVLLGGGAAAAGAVVLAKVLAVAAALFAIFVIVEDIITYIQGGDSVFGDLVAAFENAHGPVASLVKTVKEFIPEIMVFLDELWETAMVLWDAVKPAVFGIGAAIIDILAGALKFVINFLRVFIAISRQVLAFLRFVAPAVKVLATLIGGIFAIVGFLIGGAISLVAELYGLLAFVINWVGDNLEWLWDQIMSGGQATLTFLYNGIRQYLIKPILDGIDLVSRLMELAGPLGQPFADAGKALSQELGVLTNTPVSGLPENWAGETDWTGAKDMALGIRQRDYGPTKSERAQMAKVEDNSNITVNVTREKGESAAQLGDKIGAGVKDAKKGLPNAQAKTNLAGKR